MADELPLVELIKLGFEFCGSYTLAAGIGHVDEGWQIDENGHIDEDENNLEFESAPDESKITDKTLYGHQPLTSKKAIRAITDNMKGVNGQKKAQRSLRYIIERSASPMETILCMLLTLPHKIGGYGLPAPELNKRVYIKNAANSRSGKPYYLCDLFWPKAKLAVEYDSDSYHTGADRIASDSAKRFALDELGIHVITLTSRQIRNPAVFERITKQIARKLGKRLRYSNQQFKIVNRELRDLLL